MSTVAATAEGPIRARSRLRKSPFFALLGLLMLVLAIGGFWPQYFSVAIGRTPEPTTQFWLIHLHAALFLGWLVLYLMQATLIMSGQARVHLKLGPWLAGYGFAIAAVGVYAALRLAARFGERLQSFDEAAAFVFFPIIDMVYFAGFLAAAVALRKRSHLHKRAMLLATFSIAVVGWGRLVGRVAGFDDPWLWQPLILAPLLLATGYDLLVCRRLYAIMLLGLGVHLLRLNAELLTKTEWWLPIGRALVAPFR